MHEVALRETEDHRGHFGLCTTCGDRSELFDDTEEPSAWVDDHRHRSRFGNMNQPHTNWKRGTAAKTFRDRSEDPRWPKTERLLWAQLADELERPDREEEQDTLF